MSTQQQDEQSKQVLPRFRLDDTGQLKIDVNKQRSAAPGIAQTLRRRISRLHLRYRLVQIVQHIRLNAKNQPQTLSNLKAGTRWLPRTTAAYRLLGGALALFVVVGLGFHFFQQHTASDSGKVQGAQTAKPTPGTPAFSTVLPTGKQIQSLGGWYRISPPNRDPVYAFVDHIGKIEITVSEQPLPKNFQSDTAQQISNLALGFGANQKLTTSTVTAYIGTSAHGPQSVILTEHNLLILIKSTDKLSNDQWIAYLASLQ